MRLGIKQAGVLTHSNQSCSLLNVQFRRQFAEIDMRCRMDSYSLMHEIIFVEVESHYLLLGIVTFKLDCNNPL